MTKVTHSLCEGCSALCCKNLAMEIGKPLTRKEIDDLKWQLQFDTVRVYIHRHRWHQLVEGRCMHLTKDNRCAIYEHRPDKCRRHNPPDCERYGAYYDVMISTPEELEDYFRAEKERKRAQRRRRRDARKRKTA